MTRDAIRRTCAVLAMIVATASAVFAQDDDGGYTIDRGEPIHERAERAGHERAERAARGRTEPAPLDRAARNDLAVDAYRKGELDTARAEWSALLADAEGPEKARLLYDLGNVAFRAARPLEAVGWYTAALRLAPRDADAWANLEHARREAGLEPADRGDLTATLARVVTAFTRRESELLALGGVLVLGAALAYEALRGGRVARRVAIVAALLAACSFAPLATHLVRSGGDPLISIAPRERPLAVHSEPRDDAAVVAEVQPGERLQRVDELPDWTRVELSDGTQGWTRTSSVFALDR